MPSTLARVAPLLTASALLCVALAPPAAATGVCVVVGLDEGPYDNWVIARVCQPFVAVPGGCDGESLVWWCILGNPTGQTSQDVWIEHLP